MVFHRNKNFLNIRPIYFPDKHYVAIAYKNVVELHDQDHLVIWKLENESNVVALEISSNEFNKFFIAYESGDIKFCDIKTGSIIDVLQVGIQLSKIFVLDNSLLTVQKDGIYSYANFDINEKKLITKKSYSLVSFNKKTEILAMADNKELCVKNLSLVIEKRNFMNQWKRERHFTCIACHPTHNSVATGDTSGQVIIWWNVLNGFSQTSVFHWHFLKLNTIEFTHSGTHLLTGGNEGVFVKWELAVQDSEKSRRFYPRLESPIQSIRSCCGEVGEYYLLTMTDNSYHIMTSNLGCINSYYNLVQRSDFLHSKIKQRCHLNPIGLVGCHNMSNQLKYSLMTNAHEGKLQFFDTTVNATNYQLDVSCQNWPTETENEYIPGFMQVQIAAVSHCGHYIITYESIGVLMNQYDRKPSIKVFHWSDDEKFTLQSEVPFGFADQVTDIIFHPSKNENVAVITKSMKLYLLSRKKSGEHISWDMVHFIDLTETLHTYHVCISHKKYHHNAVMATIGCLHNESDGFLAIGCNSSLTIFLWSHLIDNKTYPLIAKKVDKLLYDICIDGDSKRKMVSDIAAMTIVCNENDVTRYRLVIGLDPGVLVAELSMEKDGSVVMKGINASVDKNNGSCLVSKNPGNCSQVAIMFKKRNKHSDPREVSGVSLVTVLDVWTDEKKEVFEVPDFDHISWTKVKTDAGQEKWVVAGLSNEKHWMELTTCEDIPAGDKCEGLRINDCGHEGVNLLADLEDVEMVPVEKKKQVRRTKIIKQIKALTTYDNVDFTAFLQSLYAH